MARQVTTHLVEQTLVYELKVGTYIFLVRSGDQELCAHCGHGGEAWIRGA